jgi:hypothetical protein
VYIDENMVLEIGLFYSLSSESVLIITLKGLSQETMFPEAKLIGTRLGDSVLCHAKY